MAFRITMLHGHRIAGLALAALITGTASVAAAENHPNGPIPLLTGMVSGSGADIGAQPLRLDLEKALVRPLIVENRTGESASGAQTKSLEAHVVEEERDRTCL